MSAFERESKFVEGLIAKLKIFDGELVGPEFWSPGQKRDDKIRSRSGAQIVFSLEMSQHHQMLLVAGSADFVLIGVRAAIGKLGALRHL
jgi:hypothetical protein